MRPEVEGAPAMYRCLRAGGGGRAASCSAVRIGCRVLGKASGSKSSFPRSNIRLASMSVCIGRGKLCVERTQTGASLRWIGRCCFLNLVLYPRSIAAASSGKSSSRCSLMVRCKEIRSWCSTRVQSVHDKMASHQSKARRTGSIRFLSTESGYTS